MRIQFGIDLGGTKTEWLVLGVDGNNTQVLHSARLPTPRGSYDGLVQFLANIIVDMRQKWPTITHVGMGIPGAVSPHTGVIQNANTTELIGRRLAEDLQGLVGCPVWCQNDANCFALSEAKDGAASDDAVETVFGVIIGTGCGGGIIHQGVALQGCNAIAGEWGHNPQPWLNVSRVWRHYWHDQSHAWPDALIEQMESNGLGFLQAMQRPTVCYCGQADCVETYLSGTGFFARVQQGFEYLGSELPDEIDGVKTLNAYADGLAVTHAHKHWIELAWQAYEDWFAAASAQIINVVDPDIIVLGGGMSNVSRLYVNVPNRWSNFVFSDGIRTRLLAPTHGDASGVRGAAWLGVR